MDYVTSKVRTFTERDIRFVDEFKLWTLDGLFFDTIYSILVYTGHEKWYEDLMSKIHYDNPLFRLEIERFQTYEKTLLEIDNLFNRLTNISPSKKYKGMYTFLKDTEFTFKNKTYKINKRGTVHVLHNFAGQRVGLAIKKTTNKGITVNIGPNLYYRPFKSEIYVPNIKLDTLNVASHYHHTKDNILFKDFHFPYLKKYLHTYSDKKFNIKFTSATVPRPTILLEYPYLKYLLYKNYSIDGTTLSEWIYSYSFDRKEAKELLDILNTLNVLEDIHPKFFNEFENIKKYLKQLSIYRTKSNKESYYKKISEGRKKVYYMMDATFDKKRINGMFYLVSKIDNTHLHFDINDKKYCFNQIKKYIEENKLIEKFESVIGKIYPHAINSALLEYLTEGHNELAYHHLEYEQDRQRWVLKGQNATVFLRMDENRFRVRKDLKNNDSHIWIGNPLIESIHYKKNSRQFNKIAKLFISTKTPRKYSVKIIEALNTILVTFPMLYLSSQTSGIKLHFVDQETKKIFDEILNKNFFVRPDYPLDNLYRGVLTHKSAHYTIGIRADTVRERMRKVNMAKLRHALWAEQRNYGISLLHSCKSFSCIQRKIMEKIKNIAK